MKFRKILQVLVVAVTMTSLAMALPTTTALAKETLNLSPSKGVIGDEIEVTGSGYDSGDRIYIYFSSQKADVDDDIDDLDVWVEVDTARASLVLEGGGYIGGSFEVPDELSDGHDIEKVLGGDYFVYTTERQEGRILAKEEFTVVGIAKVDPTEGPVGTGIEIRGEGFEDEEYIDVFYDGEEIEIVDGDDKTDDDGEFRLTITIPESTAGTHLITVEVDEDEGQTEFIVEPRIDISDTSGRIGNKVTVTGTGFGDSISVAVSFGGDRVANGETDDKGNFSVTFYVPAVGKGIYVVRVEDEEGNTGDKYSFIVQSYISVSPVTSQTSPGHVSMDVTISGTGFIPSHEITITYASTPTVLTTISKNDGSFSFTFKIPKSAPGSHTITATDGTNSMEVIFFMEEGAPPIPQPLEPEMDTIPERPEKFEWYGVTDPSGVTYTLQIAKDKNFTDIVLEKEGLTKSEYTMTQTEDEKLESTEDGDGYWWRVRATDGALNMSNWSGTKSFVVGVVGSIITIPTWANYLLGAVGGALLFFTGLLLVRRKVKVSG
jgi:hypothetical protein